MLLGVAVTNRQESAACTQVLKRDERPYCAGYINVCAASQKIFKEMADYYSAQSGRDRVSVTHFSTLGWDICYLSVMYPR